jgi:hypothetical protein
VPTSQRCAASPYLRERIATAARGAVQGRTWEAALAELGAGYERAAAAAARRRAGMHVARAA